VVVDVIVEYGNLEAGTPHDERRDENPCGLILTFPYVDPRRFAAYLRVQLSQAVTVPFRISGKQKFDVFLQTVLLVYGCSKKKARFTYVSLSQETL
jgi:hypothetical protein